MSEIKQQNNLPLRLCVTTMNDAIYKAIDKFSNYASADCTVHIAHQITNGKKYFMELTEHCFYYPAFESGVSKNRNNILKHLDFGIYIWCDDDVLLTNNFQNVIRQVYATQSSDIITFQTLLASGKKRKKYKSNVFYHNKISILSVSGIEITFKIESVQKKHISFDENYGLGTTIPSGEEQIFLKDCLDSGLNLSYYPDSINFHTLESSGDRRLASSKWKVFTRMRYNIFWKLLFMLFLYGKKCNKLFKSIKNNINI